jgi:ankyrin repeat protein
LQLAAENCHLKVARLLIVAWADVDKATIDTGTTPLHFAAESGQVEMLRLLTEAGADINKARTIDGPITLAE